MIRPFPLRFGLPGGVKELRVERVNTEARHWRLWLMANKDYNLGTFIQLCDDGKINRVTWHEDGTETILEYKE